MRNQLFAKKPIKILLAEKEGSAGLRQVLGPWSLASLGIGAIIGTGIFVLTGVVAHDKTGPALIVSFVAAGITCVFAALSYAEFASMVPVAGSAYTYAYATLGELFAWILGWDLILEYVVASSTVAHGWSHYFQDLISQFGIVLPHAITRAPFDFVPEAGRFVSTGTLFDVPAIVIVGIMTLILIKGIRESATFNAILVAIKIGVILFVIAVGAFFVDPANWQPFAPYGWSGLTLFGHGRNVGMLAGAAMIFFAYLGFDSVSTHAEEARNPQRDVPIGIIGSLLISTVLYLGVAVVLTGMVPYQNLNIDAPVSNAFAQVGMPWARMLVSVAALAGITSVLMVMMLSGARIVLAIARDGLLPREFFGAVHPRFRTPHKATVVVSFAVAVMAALLPLRVLAELVNIGTLFAFVVVSAAVLIMRKLEPNAHRPFRAPWVPFVPVMGILTSLLMMFSLPAENWLRLFVWLAAGLLIYFAYGMRHSIRGKFLKQP